VGCPGCRSVTGDAADVLAQSPQVGARPIDVGHGAGAFNGLPGLLETGAETIDGFRRGVAGVVRRSTSGQFGLDLLQLQVADALLFPGGPTGARGLVGPGAGRAERALHGAAEAEVCVPGQSRRDLSHQCPSRYWLAWTEPGSTSAARRMRVGFLPSH